MPSFDLHSIAPFGITGYVIFRKVKALAVEALPSGRFFTPALFVLLSLTDGAKHGYALMEDIKRQHAVDLGPGTLYAVLARLEKQGLIQPLPTRDRRRPYQLTTTGSTILRDQLLDVQRAAALGLQRLATR